MQVLKEMNGSEGNPNFIIVNLLQKSGRDTAVPFALKPTVIVPRQIDPLIESRKMYNVLGMVRILERTAGGFLHACVQTKT